jgi:rhodanese-related sulfurtransferase
MIATLMGLKTISPAELLRQMHDGRTVCCDVNSPQSWKSAHVPGACHLDHAAYTESDLPADRKTPLVFYCSNHFCRKAPTAARRAIQMGFRDVRVMSAGISGWLADRLPTEVG